MRTTVPAIVPMLDGPGHGDLAGGADPVKLHSVDL